MLAADLSPSHPSDPSLLSMLAACAPVPRPVVFPGYPATTVAASGDRDRGVKRAICCLAGPVAESACSGVSLDRLLADTSAADDVEMARAALALDARAPPFGVVLAATQRLVATNWPVHLLWNDRFEADSAAPRAGRG